MKYFSLFTGIGGLDLGLEKRGAKCVGYSDIKVLSIRIYSSHYPEHKNFGDITLINFKELPDFDMLTGGFPCQSFSMAGMRKGFDDGKGKKGAMVLYIHRLLLAKKPQYFVLENVKWILNHDEGKTYKKVFRLFESAGYHVRVVLFNSALYGSAQARERVLFIGSRTKFELPAPRKVDGTKLFRDIRDHVGPFKWVSEIAMKRLEAGGRFIFLGGYDRVNTLTTGMSSSGRDMLVVQEENGRFRYLTALEGERLQGFPDGWTVCETEGNRWFGIGNAVNGKVSEYVFTEYLPKVFSWK